MNVAVDEVRRDHDALRVDDCRRARRVDVLGAPDRGYASVDRNDRIGL